MDIEITPANVGGIVHAPVSKSDAHRKLILAALGRNSCFVKTGNDPGEDIKATLRCLAALGAGAEVRSDGIVVTPGSEVGGDFDCGESGSTLRFLVPVAAMHGFKGTFSGRGRLPQRPIGVLLDEIFRHGVKASADALPFELDGKWDDSTVVSLPGDVSSQFITGFLLAMAPFGRGVVKVSSPLQSAGYVDITIKALKDFGINTVKSADSFSVSGQMVSPAEIDVDGDWSNGAFLLAAGAIAGDMEIRGLDIDSPQGDRRILEVMRRFGVKYHVSGKSIFVRRSNLTGAGDIDMGDIPDLGPVISVLAAFADGKTRLVNAARLKLKESDRIASTAAMLTALGVEVSTGEATLEICGKSCVHGGIVDAAGDHRIVMSAAVAALAAKEKVVISRAENVSKSWPGFFDVLESIKRV